MATQPDLSAFKDDNNAPVYALSAIRGGTQNPQAQARPEATRTSVAEAIAAIMPRLGLVELRICIHLANLAEAHERENPGWFVATASLREIESATGCKRSNITAAIASLITNGYLAKREGTTEKASVFLVKFLSMVGVVPKRDQGGPKQGPGGSQTETRGVPFRESQIGTTPTMDETYVSRGRADSIDSDRSIRSIEAAKSTEPELDPWKTEPLERVAKARPSHFRPQDLATASKWIHGYRAKFGGKETPHAPDASIVAQFLAVAPWPALLNMLQDLMAERREPGRSYAWFVAVALQRIHGIGPEEQRRGRAALRVMPTPAEREAWTLTPPTGPNSPPQFCDDSFIDGACPEAAETCFQQLTNANSSKPDQKPLMDETGIESGTPSHGHSSGFPDDFEALDATKRPEVSHEGGSGLDATENENVSGSGVLKPEGHLDKSGEAVPDLQELRQQLAAIAADKRILGFGERKKPPPT